MTTPKIVALIDGSIFSGSVCDYAAWIGRRTGQPIELVHVLERAAPGGVQDLSGTIQYGARSSLLHELSALDEESARQIAGRGQQLLDAAQAQLAVQGVSAVTARLRHGDLLQNLAEIEAEPGGKTLLIGKRGTGRPGAKGHLGSHLKRVLRQTRLPVIVAPHAFVPVGTVLVAYDGSPGAQKAVEEVAAAALFRGTTVRLLTIGTETPALRESLAEAQSILHRAELAVQTDIIAGHAHKELGPYLEHGHFDMLVMGSYSHSRLGTLLTGSTTEIMLRTTSVPLLLLR